MNLERKIANFDRQVAAGHPCSSSKRARYRGPMVKIAPAASFADGPPAMAMAIFRAHEDRRARSGLNGLRTAA